MIDRDLLKALHDAAERRTDWEDVDILHRAMVALQRVDMLITERRYTDNIIPNLTTN